LDSLITNRLNAFPSLATQMFVAVVGASGVILSWKRLVAITIATFVGWLVFAYPGEIFAAHGGMHQLVTLTMAVAIAFAIHAGRIRAHAIIFQQELSIHTALTKSSTELEERQRVEREREHYRNMLMQTHKMEALGTLASGIARDMNHTLTAIMSIGELMQEDYDSGDPVWEDVAQILAAARRGISLTRDIMAFSNKESPRKEPVDVGHLVRQVTGFLERTATRHKTIQIEGTEGLIVDADYAQISQVLINLCTNGLDAIETEGLVIVRTESTAVEGPLANALQISEGSYVRIDVIDNGVGMEESTQQRIFDPFFSTKSGGGTGLGLSLAFSTIRNHGGAIDVESTVGKGTRMSLFLPRSNIMASSPSASVRQNFVTDGVGTILLVDDEDLVRRSGKRVLERLGYQVLIACDAPEALALVSDRAEHIDLVLLDVAMPQISGIECAKAIQIASPETKIVLSSALPADDAMQSALGEVDGWVQKPYTIDNLAEVLLAALQGLAPISHAAPRVPSSSREPTCHSDKAQNSGR
jgi:signal transduction histidine kinase/ActR/RegA family two-component response regulator